MRLDVPSAARNPISLVGVAITTATAVVFFVLFALELGGQITQSLFRPAALRGGAGGVRARPAADPDRHLAPAPPGGRRRRPRRLAGHRPAPPAHPHRCLCRRVLTIVNLMIVSLAAYGAVHHMESVEFCGTTCHTTMEPEWAAHQVSPHAHVACVSCHVGPGAEGLVESKITGTRQLWQVSPTTCRHRCRAGAQHAPGARDLRDLPLAREDARRQAEAGPRVRRRRDEHRDDHHAAAARRRRRRRARAGSGIHWHMNIDNRVEFIATDAERQVIPWVKFTDATARSKEYVVDGMTPEQLAKGERRMMDCLDCHNRPAHTFEPRERAVDNAIARGHIPARPAVRPPRSGGRAQGRVPVERRAWPASTRGCARRISSQAGASAARWRARSPACRLYGRTSSPR